MRADSGYRPWVLASFLLFICVLLIGGCPTILLPLVSATSFFLTVLFAKFPSRISQDADSRSNLLEFFTELSVEMSSGISPEAALSRKIQSGNRILAPVERSAVLRLLSGASADAVLRALPTGSPRDDMKDFYSKMVKSGGADALSAAPFLDSWAENLSLIVESNRGFEEISRRAELLHYLISFTMGFLSASTPMVARLRDPYFLESGAPSSLPMFLSLFFLKSSIFVISSRKFRFSRPHLKFVVGAMIMTFSFLMFTNLLSLF